MTYLISLSIGLAVFWLLLSGYWDNGLLLSLGFASITFVVFISHRIERHSRFQPLLDLILRLPGYWWWLLIEIIHANIAVIRSVWLPKRYPIKPAMQALPMSQKTPVGQTLYANSITLTPGTVSVSIDDQQVLVHALHQDNLDELAEGEMDQRVTRLESGL